MERSPQEDIGEVLNVVIDVAKGLIDDGGEFAPFGAAVDNQGQVRMFVPVSEDEDVSMEWARDRVYEELQRAAAAKEIRASAVCLDIHMREPKATDAILVALEHAEGDALSVYMPYFSQDGLPPVYDDHWAERAEPKVFA